MTIASFKFIARIRSEGIDKFLDITKPGSLASDFFDLVICINVLEDISDPHNAVDEMYRALKYMENHFWSLLFCFPFMILLSTSIDAQSMP